MRIRTATPALARCEEFNGMWVALDGCRYDPNTRQPVEGDVVDADEDLAELCARMRETGRSSCTILLCDDDVLVESTHTWPAQPPARTVASR
jgi:hypothetical protein